jgi:hypothetical protein
MTGGIEGARSSDQTYVSRVATDFPPTKSPRTKTPHKAGVVEGRDHPPRDTSAEPARKRAGVVTRHPRATTPVPANSARLGGKKGASSEDVQ